MILLNISTELTDTLLKLSSTLSLKKKNFKISEDLFEKDDNVKAKDVKYENVKNEDVHYEDENTRTLLFNIIKKALESAHANITLTDYKEYTLIVRFYRTRY